MKTKVRIINLSLGPNTADMQRGKKEPDHKAVEERKCCKEPKLWFALVYLPMLVCVSPSPWLPMHLNMLVQTGGIICTIHYSVQLHATTAHGCMYNATSTLCHSVRYRRYKNCIQLCTYMHYSI